MKLFNNKKQLLEQKENEYSDFLIQYEKLKGLLSLALEKYNNNSCQCAFPRFQQIIGINCTSLGIAFMCYETEIFIELAQKYFNISESKLNDECTNTKWTCKKCFSIYEFGWSDFSIHINRQKLELIDLKIKLIGKSIKEPIPLNLGLIGHSYPSKINIKPVEFDVFEKYILEM